jgi:glycosyltransferase involved in cell wall biosynthesis
MLIDESSNIELAFIGIVVPDEAEYINEAFSRAGNMCQTSLLLGLLNAGVTPAIILSARPLPSFPRSRQIIVKNKCINIIKKIPLKLLPFINITPVKQATIGIATLWYLVLWGWKMRNVPQRVVYTYNISVPSGIFTLLGAWVTQSKCVAMIYDVLVPGETAPATIFYKIDYWLHKKLLPLFDGLVVISENIAKDFAPSVPCLRVEGGISTDLIERIRNFERQSAYDGDFFTIVVTGALEEVNGIREILLAFKLLEGKKYRLWIAGHGSLSQLVREAVADDSRIRYVGFVSFEEVLKLYALADVLINMRLTKRINTRYFFPSKLMEYLSSGVPVISTSSGNIADEYGQLAYILKEETPESLAELIKLVAQTPDEERRSKAEYAQQYIAKHKTWDAQTRLIRNFLVEIVHDKH